MSFDHELGLVLVVEGIRDSLLDNVLYKIVSAAACQSCCRLARTQKAVQGKDEYAIGLLDLGFQTLEDAVLFICRDSHLVPNPRPYSSCQSALTYTSLYLGLSDPIHFLARLTTPESPGAMIPSSTDISTF
jgi:hypothetical protein